MHQYARDTIGISRGISWDILNEGMLTPLWILLRTPNRQEKFLKVNTSQCLIVALI